MSKYVKNLIMQEITGKFTDVEGVAVINPRGIDATKTNQLRRKLRQAKLKMTVVKNSLARKALEGSKIKGFEQLLDGPSALVYGQASVPAIARLLLDQKKDIAKLELRGVFFDGEVYAGEKGVETASKLPTREEAIGSIVAAMLGPGRKLGGILKGQAGKVGALIKAVEEKAKKAEEAGGAAAAAEPAPAA